MVEIKNDVIFDKNNNLGTDIYLPDKPNNKVLIFWHGGGWIRGDKAGVANYGKTFAENGFTTFIPNYRLAPKDSFPAAHDDTVTFVNWLLESDYTDNDGKNVVQIGASSGGVMALYLAGKYGFPTVTWSAPVNYSDWMSDHASVKASIDAQNELGLTDAKEINNSFYKYFGLAYAGNSSKAALQKLDAKSYDYSKLNKLLMINSTDELSPIKYVLDFLQVLAKNNHGCDLEMIPGTKHAMAYADEYVEKSLAYLN